MNIVQFPTKPANGRIAAALSGNIYAFNWLINTFAQSQAELRLILDRAGVKDYQLTSDNPTLIGQVARALLTMPIWVPSVHRAVRLLKPHNRNRLVNDLPYCIQPTADRNAWCVVNRGYKPICADVEFPYIRFESADYAHITRKHFENLKRAGAVDDGGYFYTAATLLTTAFRIAAYRRRVAALLEPWALL